MANQLKGVYENIIYYAKKEFLEKGYNDASLRNIAVKAGTSTGSIYTRFTNKEGLYTAIVAPAIEKLEEIFLNAQKNFASTDKETQEEKVQGYSMGGIRKMIEYIYDNRDEFKLLLECSEETKFSDFIDDMVRIEVEYTFSFLEKTGRDTDYDSSRDFLHIVFSAFYTGIFEIIRHDMLKEEGIRYAEKLREFYFAGFKQLFM